MARHLLGRLRSSVLRLARSSRWSGARVSERRRQRNSNASRDGSGFDCGAARGRGAGHRTRPRRPIGMIGWPHVSYYAVRLYVGTDGNDRVASRVYGFGVRSRTIPRVNQRRRSTFSKRINNRPRASAPIARHRADTPTQDSSILYRYVDFYRPHRSYYVPV